MRSVSTEFRQDIESSSATDVVVMFITLTHADLEVPVRVNSDVVDYVYGGETFYGTGVSISLLTDEDSPPQAKVTIPNVDPRIGEGVLALSSSPTIKIELIMKSDFDENAPREPLGTPTVEYSAPLLYLRNVHCDAMGLSGSIGSKDLSTEAWPKYRTIPQDAPALFR